MQKCDDVDVLLKQRCSCVLKLFINLFINHILLSFQLLINNVNDMYVSDTFETAFNLLLNITTLRRDDIDTKYYLLKIRTIAWEIEKSFK